MKTLVFCTILSASVYGAVDVKAFGAAGNGAADDTNAIQNAVNACPVNGTVTFPAGNFLVRGIWLRPNCTYLGANGGTTLTMTAANGFIFRMGEQSGVHISGITLDGNSLGGGIIMDGYAPVTGTVIENCEFRNVVSTAIYPANLAMISTWGFINGTIQNNRFSNVAGGMWLTTVENVNILNNTFTDVTQSDAIYIAPNPVSFPSGDNLRIAGNTGTRLRRMAIEIFRPDPTNGSILSAPVIENNTFSDWTGTVDAMGLSITHGDGAIIRGNRISNGSGPMGYIGIEVIVANAQITSNVVAGGFYYGVVIQGTAAPVITNNTITGAGDTAILFACDSARGRCASRNSVVSHNFIQNARFIGIRLENDWTGGQITRNTVVRTSGAWDQDNTTWFSGIHQSPAPGPGTIDYNTVVQDSPTPVPGFWFCGVRVNSQMPGSTIRNNVVNSASILPFGSGLIDNTGNATQGWVITGNQYVNVYHAIN